MATIECDKNAWPISPLGRVETVLRAYKNVLISLKSEGNK